MPGLAGFDIIFWMKLSIRRASDTGNSALDSKNVLATKICGGMP